jgi:hypothetical protein
MRRQSVTFGLKQTRMRRQSVTVGLKETRMRQQSVTGGLQALDLKMKAIARFRAAQLCHGVAPWRVAQLRRGLAEQFAGQVKIRRERFACIGGAESTIEFVPVDRLLVACPEQHQINDMAKLNLVQGI